jgi:DNA-binding response OmpR family regulator
MKRQAMRAVVLAPTKGDAARYEAMLAASWLATSALGLDEPTLHEALRSFAPSVLVLVAEPDSEELASALGHLELCGLGELPVALVVKRATPQAMLTPFRVGVVGLLERARLDDSVLRALLLSVEERPGLVRGTGAFHELPALLNHVTQYHRSGSLTVTGEAGGDARFEWGRLQRASCGAAVGEAALEALKGANSGWAFHEEAPIVEDRFGADPQPEAPTRRTVLSQETIAQLRARSDTAAAKNGVRLLVVDDDEATLKLVGGYFSRKGYETVVAPGGADALATLGAQRFDVAVLDLNMPRIDGWSVLAAMGDDVRTRETLVLLYSAHDDYREVLLRAGLGAHAALPKTARLNEVEEKVVELLAPRRQALAQLRAWTVDDTLPLDVDSLGVQWLVRACAAVKVTGALDLATNWARWRLWFVEGRLCQARCQGNDDAATHTHGDVALWPLLTARGLRGRLTDGDVPPGEGFEGNPTLVVLSDLVGRLALEQHRLYEARAAQAESMEVNTDLYALYAHVGPPAARPIAEALCEQHLSMQQAAEVLAVPDAQVKQVVKDLLRRGVVHLLN